MCPAAPISSAVMRTASNSDSKCTAVLIKSAASIAAKPIKHIGMSLFRTAEAFALFLHCAARTNEAIAAMSVKTAPAIIDTVAPTVIFVG